MDIKDPKNKQEPIDNKDMKKAFPVMKRTAKATKKDLETFDLDITPMMNIFMILIPFLVSMAVFTQIAVVEFSLPPAQSPGAAGSDEQTK